MEPSETTPWHWKKRETPTMHDHLWEVCKTLPSDFEPYGSRKRDEVVRGEARWYPDCSCGCKFFKKVEGPEGSDWGVCWNPNSPRKGLLTFEHQGCPSFDYEEYQDGEKYDEGEETTLETSPENPPQREEDPI